MRAVSKHAERDEVPLTGILAEFRTALQDEIAAARRNASSAAVPLLNGRRIAQVGGSYQYVFDIENALNLPGDAPGDLYVPGQSPLEVVVISVEGLTITVSIPVDLGTFVPNARLQSNLAYLMRKLIERIETLANTPNPAGDRVLGILPISGKPVPVKLPETEYNHDQKKAVASSLGRDTTFIWGPPGTGKTRTIGAIGEQLYRQGRSVLLVSHTNVAVDEAILRIGKAIDPAELDKGQVLRVGDPRDPRLRDHNLELRLETHVARRSAKLTERRKALQDEYDVAITDSLRLSRSIDICEWVAEAQEDIAAMTEELRELQCSEVERDRARAVQFRLVTSAAYWDAAAQAAQTAQHYLTEMATLDKRIAELRRRRSLDQTKLVKAAECLREAKQLLVQAEAIAPLRAQACELPSLEIQTMRVDLARAEKAEIRKSYDGGTSRLSEAEAIYSETSSVGRLTRTWRRLPAPEVQLELVERIRDEVDAACQQQTASEKALSEAEALLSEVTELAEQLRTHIGVPEAEGQQHVVSDRLDQVAILRTELADAKRTLLEAEARRANLVTELDAFRREYSGEPDDILRQGDAHAAELAEVQSRLARYTRQCGTLRRELEDLLQARLTVLRQWALTTESQGAAEAMLSAIRKAYERAAYEVEGLDLDGLRAERNRLNERIRDFEAEIHEIEEALKRVEELVIADAMVVATTLTRAYLRDVIQKRRFDTVILDEASMAPIPSLWVAASLADANAVVVGDFKQLPPIVISTHELARKWLGRDIFEAAGLSNPDTAPPYFLALCRQYRMHPNISSIPNALIYDDLLNDDESTFDGKSDDSLSGWYRYDWGHDQPVLLADTGSVGAWVTSVARGKRSSRLNFLSATICVDLAEQLLRDGRPEFVAGDKPRILIICPYRPHAQLLDLLLREQGLKGEVVAGTVHNFQGSEADVVILDLVNDEPHWRVAMFIPNFDGNTRRLLNVALTRAKRRLVIVGDFDYIAKHAKKAFVGTRLIPFLQKRYPCVDALDVVPVGLAARAAKTQAAVLGGDVEPNAARLVVTQEEFYPMLRGDLARATRRVVIYSAFITSNRLGQIEPPIRAAVERGVRVYVITKARGDRGKRELPTYRMLEEALTKWGVVVVHKRRMHEKLVFIDDDILWMGSLNPLSFSDTQEVMERRKSRKVVDNFVQKLRLNELIGEYEEGVPTCPICESEVVASEGTDEPFYWRCIKRDCYTRNIDQPPLKGGVINCAKCGGKVEYGEWGGKPAWRCLKDRHHHQKIAHTHLRLPKMREIMPKRELCKLDRSFGTSPPDSSSAIPDSQRQLRLF